MVAHFRPILRGVVHKLLLLQWPRFHLHTYPCTGLKPAGSTNVTGSGAVIPTFCFTLVSLARAPGSGPIAASKALPAFTHSSLVSFPRWNVASSCLLGCSISTCPRECGGRHQSHSCIDG